MPDAVKNILTDFLNQGKDAGVDFAKQFVFGKIQGTPEAALEEKIDNNSLNGSGPIDADAARMLPQTLEETITGKAKPPDPVVAQSNTPIMLFGALAAIVAVIWATQR